MIAELVESWVEFLKFGTFKSHPKFRCLYFEHRFIYVQIKLRILRNSNISLNLYAALSYISISPDRKIHNQVCQILAET